MNNLAKLSTLLVLFLFFPVFCSFSQVGINSGNTEPDPTAGLDVNFADKGFLLPRLTQEQILAISDPANGLIVFCKTDNRLYVYISAALAWRELPFGVNMIGAPFPCGINITINHVAGNVAPVNKTVTYGTATGIPGETAKCWIDRNLGASQQATAVNDATEGSAGWYWQFNLKQGYKHDGANRTPFTTWISSISENSDWTAVNDPCSIELGSPWRIPTYTEWNNVYNTGDWENWNGPWNSGLNLHAAGYLDYSDGSMDFRGIYAGYWSSTQFSTTTGWDVGFHIEGSTMYSDSKAVGLTLRCLRE
jgi:hypothetical protein